MNKKLSKKPSILNASSWKSKALFIAGFMQVVFEAIVKKALVVFGVSAGQLDRFLVISFNQTSIEIIHVKSTAGRIKILAYDMYQDLPGTSQESRIIDQYIAKFLHKNAVHDKNVILNIADGNSVIIHCLALPDLPEGEILEAAKFKLKDEVPFDFESAPIDWQYARKYENDEGAKNCDVVFAVADIKAINRYLSCVCNCSLQPVGVTAGIFNYSNIIKNLTDTSEISSVLDIDYAFATLSIYRGSQLLFVRRIPVSWKMFTDTLTKIFDSEKGEINISIEEAEQIKVKYGIPQDENLLIKGTIRGGHVMALLRPHLEAMVRELKLSFNYIAVNFEMEKPTILYTVGGGADLKNLELFLGKELDMDVSRLPIPDCVQSSKTKKEKPDKEALLRYVNAIGAALGDSNAINLLPKEIKAQKAEFLQKVSLRVGGATVAIIFLCLQFLSNAQVNDYRSRLQMAKQHIEVIGGIRDLREKLILREGLIEKIQKNKIPGNGILKVLGVLIPNKVILNELFFDQASYSLVLRGIVTASEDTAGSVLSGFMNSLESSSYFSEASLLSSQRTGTLQAFEIKCDFPK